ncbi:MAG TPA: DUF488 family protein [Nitrospirota bacterium]|nr:DUF488 family protein [Nitrospirota bacterium]
MVKIKRVYDEPSESDGKRILVDRLWPRGLKKEHAQIDGWIREIAPSNELRKWFNHDPHKWREFKNRFFMELEGKGDLLEGIANLARKGSVTLLFGSKEERFNNAVALKEYIDAKMKVADGKRAARGQGEVSERHV